MLEEKLKYLEMLMANDPLSPEMKALAQEIKESCHTEEEKRMLDEFISKGISSLTTDVDNLHKEVIKLLCKV